MVMLHSRGHCVLVAKLLLVKTLLFMTGWIFGMARDWMWHALRTHLQVCPVVASQPATRSTFVHGPGSHLCDAWWLMPLCQVDGPERQGKVAHQLLRACIHSIYTYLVCHNDKANLNCFGARLVEPFTLQYALMECIQIDFSQSTSQSPPESVNHEREL